MAERLLAKGEKGQHQCSKCLKLFDFVGNGQWIPTTCPKCSNKSYMVHFPLGDYTDVQGAASHANVSPATIRAWILSGELKTIKLGGAHIIKLEDLEAAMKVERKPGPKEKREK